MVYINPVFWSINGLVGTQLGDVQESMTLQDGGTTQVCSKSSVVFARLGLVHPGCQRIRLLAAVSGTGVH